MKIKQKITNNSPGFHFVFTIACSEFQGFPIAQNHANLITSALLVPFGNSCTLMPYNKYSLLMIYIILFKIFDNQKHFSSSISVTVSR